MNRKLLLASQVASQPPFECVVLLNPGRKREFEGDGPAGDKKPRFDGSGDEDQDVPPATLRVLIRNSDAGGIIGKVGNLLLLHC